MPNEVRGTNDTRHESLVAAMGTVLSSEEVAVAALPVKTFSNL